MPPGNPPAHARAIAHNFAAPTMKGANGLAANEAVTSMTALADRSVDRPGQTAE